MTVEYKPDEMRLRLKSALDEKRLSMRKASLDAGLSNTYIHGIIELGREPSVENLVKICNTHNLSASHIMYGYDVSAPGEEILQLLQSHPEKVDAILSLLRE